MNPLRYLRRRFWTLCLQEALTSPDNQLAIRYFRFKVYQNRIK